MIAIPFVDMYYFRDVKMSCAVFHGGPLVTELVARKIEKFTQINHIPRENFQDDMCILYLS